MEYISKDFHFKSNTPTEVNIKIGDKCSSRNNDYIVYAIIKKKIFYKKVI